MPRERSKNQFTVGVVGGDRSNILYSGTSYQYAQHDAHTARVAAMLSGGTLLIVTRKNGNVISSVNVTNGQAVENQGVADAKG